MRCASTLRSFVLVLSILASGAGQAAQYSSEYREVEPEAAEVKKQSPEEILKSLKNNSYGKALSLQQFAREAIAEERYDDAIGWLEQALELDALSEFAAADMQSALAQLYVADGRHDKVVEILGAQLQQDSDARPELKIALANSLVHLKRHREALPWLREALRSRKSPPIEWLQLSLAADVALQRWSSAASTLEGMLVRDPRNATWWEQLTAIHLKLGNVEKALSVMDLAHRQGFLETAEEQLHYIRLFLKHDLPFEAATLLQGWIQGGVLDESIANLELLANAWMKARERGEALRIVRKLAARKGDARSYLYLAQLSIEVRDWDSAAEALETALRLGRLGNATPRAWMSLGMARYQTGNVDGAIEAFRRATAHASARDVAGQWLTYLESGIARENAIREAVAQGEALLASTGSSGRFDFQPSGFGPDAGRNLRAANRASLTPPEPFTPVGAEWAGNADGSIPAWSGGLTPGAAPAGYVDGGRVVDPFPNEKPLFVITAKNMNQYQSLLSDAHQQLLLKYPDYRIPVYPTHRSVSYPQEIYDATRANEGVAELLGSDALSKARLGFPFRKPDNGVEIMWNHRVRFRGNATRATSTQMVVDPDGRRSNVFRQTEIVFYRYSNLRDPVDINKRNILLYYLTYFSDDGRTPKIVALVHETANSMAKPRAIWVLPPNIKKLFRIPPVGYDNPFPASGGISFIDMIDMYNGAFDRYVWRLVGKREMIVPYNSYRLNDGSTRYADLATGRFLNPDKARYEKHRVWVIEATERGGKRHSFGKRIFYVDEDSWNVLMVENHDRDERLWRFQEGHLLPLYHAQFANTVPVVTYDLRDGRYFINRLTNEEPVSQFEVTDYRERDFLPSAVKNRYAR